MKVQDFRIGNYVRASVYGKGVREWIHATGKIDAIPSETQIKIGEVILWNIDGISGIELDDEWLLKLGFSKLDRWLQYEKNLFLPQECLSSITVFQQVEAPHYTHDQKKYFFIKTGEVLLRNDGVDGEPTSGFAPFEYVHQLQNLYFAFTGEELTVNS
ncbi:hypothetical protein [Mucilaginibacter sp. UYCu711]|uniref:hypothetical protein n=1 Tax=Mucilaginibacter sp. UYCu711 TaxID=3156339 RepID=UPI003D248A01